MISDSTFIFIWRRTPPPLFVGGAEVSQNDLAIELAKEGAQVIFAGSLKKSPSVKQQKEFSKEDLCAYENIKNLTVDRSYIRYQYRGVECITAPQNELNNLLKELCQKYSGAYLISAFADGLEFLQKGKEQGMQTIAWLHTFRMKICESDPDYTLSASRFVSKRAKKKRGIKSPVFYPPFPEQKAEYMEPGECITFINPIPEKGSDFFLEVACSLPERKFLVVEGWFKNEDFIKKAPSNISYLPEQNDMDKVWKQTRILLVPSEIQEAFGRVVVEAGLKGIPSITSNRGGLREALNGSGKALPYGDLKKWIKTIRSWDNPKSYEKARQTAFKAAQFFKRDIVEEFEAIIAHSQKSRNIFRF